MKFAMISAYMTEKEAHYHSNVSFNRGSLLPSKFFDKSINKVVLSFQSHDKVMASIVATSNSTAKHNLNNLHHECSHTSHVRLLVRKLVDALGPSICLLIYYLDFLDKSSKWHIDRIFSSAALLFSQLFIFHAINGSNTVPVVFAWLPNMSNVNF